MATIVFGMMQSLDGYVAGVGGELEPPLHSPGPGIALFRHWIDHVRTFAGSVYGRRMYEVMRYWEEDRAEWDASQHEFAAAWRAQPKWVASRTLTSVGTNAQLIVGDVPAFVRRLKAETAGAIDVAGPELAASLTSHGLVDEYHLYLRPFVLGCGKPYFAAARPPLRFVRSDTVGEDAIRLVFVPA